ncbi:hypothetical protein [Burkholderia cepacia]|uniref:hypothetical protein n=1 Tax=Burkholderia cepacia TaxID=292 RepID=UPI000A425192|nr:hypothetical protein [Burkholderia cepacia]
MAVSQTRFENRKRDVANIVQVGLNLVKDYATLAQNGMLSEVEALEQLRKDPLRG